MKKYTIIAIAAFVLEIASTMYIKNVSDRSAAMVFWAAMAPWLTLPFVGYMVESKNWKERILMAISQSGGYAIGALLIYLTK
jgi:hypothetical protein